MKKPLTVIIIAIFLSAFVVAQTAPLVLHTSIQNLEEMKDDPYFYNSLGNYLLNKGNFEKALKAYKIALLLSPSDEQILNNIGVYYWMIGNEEEAKNYFSQASEKNLEYENARSNLAYLYNKDGNYADAKSELRFLVEKNSNNPSYNYDLAINIAMDYRYNKEGDLKEAIKYFEKANELSQGYEKAKENIDVLKNVLSIENEN
ncbi:MAG: tetratricopeptide repeat protein [Nanoarchaeota archaeon]|nr:tetratricopeptide repeat protein [Nanoarchaeota archaeon]MBU1030791.1 tetratricopeptide repeat protein [Nanoarchaeota archaeon]MBU1849983.1 tetratricopeptide repeat protein [Nanoarchaeota archaeon]